VVSKNTNDRNFAIVAQLQAFAEARGHTAAELALAWLLANPVVGAIITGVSSPEQVAMNVKAAGWVLTPEEKTEVDAIAPRLGDDSDQRWAPAWRTGRGCRRRPDAPLVCRRGRSWKRAPMAPAIGAFFWLLNTLIG